MVSMYFRSPEVLCNKAKGTYGRMKENQNLA